MGVEINDHRLLNTYSMSQNTLDDIDMYIDQMIRRRLLLSFITKDILGYEEKPDSCDAQHINAKTYFNAFQ